MNKPQAPIVGEPIGFDEVAERLKTPREFMAWLRERTLNLGAAG